MVSGHVMFLLAFSFGLWICGVTTRFLWVCSPKNLSFMFMMFYVLSIYACMGEKDGMDGMSVCEAIRLVTDI